MEDKDKKFDFALLEKGILTEIKEIEVTRIEKEIELEKIKLSSKKEPIQKGILIALVGLIATLLGTIADGVYSRTVERDKFESNLIINEIKKNNAVDRIEGLQFLISANLITGDNYKNIKIILDSDVNDRPLLLREFEDANYSNVESDFGLKTKYDEFNYTIKNDTLIIEITKLNFTQFQARGNSDKTTTISRITAGINYYTDNNGNWNVLLESSPYIIDKTITIGEKHEIHKVSFSIDLSKTEENYNYFFTLFVYEYSGSNKLNEGYSTIDLPGISL